MKYYLLTINMISFITYGIDKLCAIKKTRRIPERILITQAFIGGPFGSLLGMHIFHHKTKKLKFKIMIPIILILWIIMIYYF